MFTSFFPPWVMNLRYLAAVYFKVVLFVWCHLGWMCILKWLGCLVSQKDDQTTSQFFRHARGEMVLVDCQTPTKNFKNVSRRVKPIHVPCKREFCTCKTRGVRIDVPQHTFCWQFETVNSRFWLVNILLRKIKTQLLWWKTTTTTTTTSKTFFMNGFIDPSCSMLQTLEGRRK